MALQSVDVRTNIRGGNDQREVRRVARVEFERRRSALGAWRVGVEEETEVEVVVVVEEVEGGRRRRGGWESGWKWREAEVVEEEVVAEVGGDGWLGRGAVMWIECGWVVGWVKP